jgi:glycosyltransferase involved in cell wall biosynthesis
VKSAINAVEMYLHHNVLRIYEAVSVFVAPSLFMRDKLRYMGFRGRVRVVPNVVDTGIAVSTGDAGRDGIERIVYAGRLSPDKGLFTLIDSAARLARIRPGARYILVGDGPLRMELERHARVSGAVNVEFWGAVPPAEIPSILAGARCGILPSECYENNPRFVLEAFAQGIPVAGSRIGGIPELVRDGETGYTFVPGDSSDCARAVERLLDYPAAAAAMGKRARVMVLSRHAPDAYYKGISAAYEDALMTRGGFGVEG